MEAFIKFLDSPESKIAIPIGKTMIGRGPFLSSTDKRVSRNHAELEFTDKGNLLIVPKHKINLTYHYPNGDRKLITPLKAEQPVKLRNGDWISFLKDALFYEITLNSSNAGDAESDSDEGETQPYTMAVKECQSPADNGIEEPAGGAENKGGRSEDKEAEDVLETSGFQRKRILPDWLLSAANSRPADDDVNAEKRSKKKVTRVKEPAAGTSGSPSTSRNVKAVNASTKTVKDDFIMSDSEGEEDVKPKRPRKKRPAKPAAVHDISDGSDADDKPTNAKASTAKANTAKASKSREPCPFGRKCYRKNPDHFKECSHPGDADYKSEPEDPDDDDRPECEYGTDCYRKNPQHLKDYKHSKRPQRKAAKDAKRKVKEADDSEDGAYDSSFIDDDDDDAAYNPDKDDADYSPEEDLDELRKEADAFKKNKKLYTVNK